MTPTLVIVAGLVGAFSGGSIVAETPVGWRGDGSGRFPDATPPTEWSTETNVRWRTELPGRSFGSPVLVGDRVFVTAEPAELLCLRASDGEILWRRSNSADDLLGPERAGELHASFAALQEELKQTRNRFGTLRKQNPEAKEELARLKQQIEAIERRIEQAVLAHPVGSGRARNSTPTPVSDGKQVYAAFGTGILAAYSLSGEKQWMRFVEGSNIGFGHSSSPALIDGKLVVHYTDLVALDVADGSEVWRRKLTATHASPVAARFGEARVLVSPAGTILRAEDGRVLADDLFRLSECSPVVHEDVVFAHGNGKLQALRLVLSGDGSAELENLWSTAALRGRRTPSTVYHRGLLYGVTTEGILEVTDAATGEIVYRKRLELGRVYSSATAAGDYIYISGTDGTTLVLRAGREFQEVARNKLDGVGSCPVFVDGKMFLRTQKYLYCIETGRRAGSVPHQRSSRR